MIRLILSVFIFAVFASSSSGATALFSFDSFVGRTALFKACTNAQQTFIRETLVAGLKNINELNHDLLADRIAHSGSRRAVFSCETGTKLGAESVANTINYRQRHILIFHFDQRLMNAPINVGAYLSRPDTDDLLVPKEVIVLHEFLHFLMFDNLSPFYHNDDKAMNAAEVFIEPPKGKFTSFAGQMLDTVYSCSVAAFPGKAEKALLFRSTGWRAAESTAACQSSKVVKGKVVLDVAPLPYFGGDHTVHSSSDCLFKNRKPWAAKDPRPNVPGWSLELREKCAIK